MKRVTSESARLGLERMPCRRSPRTHSLAVDLRTLRQAPVFVLKRPQRANMPPTPPTPLAAARARANALLMGVSTRRHVRVRSMAPGLVLVNISGDQACFRRVGLGAAFTDHDNATRQRLAYVALTTQRYEGTVLAGESGLRSATSFADDALGAANQERQQAGAVINGAFFNFLRRGNAERAEHTPIGAMCTAGRVHDSLPIPSAYAGDYVRLGLADGSYVESAPLLSLSGAPVFFPTRCQADGYRLPDGFSFETGCIRPGELLHAADPNPRAGISVPVTDRPDTVRLAVGLANGRGAATCSGYSLASWSGVMARLDTLGNEPHVSVNLDGGNSVALIVSDGRGERVHIGQAQESRPIGSAIAFTDRTRQMPDAPDAVRHAPCAGVVGLPAGEGNERRKKGQP